MLSSTWLFGEETGHKSRRATGLDTRPDLVFVTVPSFNGRWVLDPVRGCDTNSNGLDLPCGTVGDEVGVGAQGGSVGLG